MPRRPDHPREPEPFIRKGDSLFIERGGPAGCWEVLEAKYRDASSDRIDLVLKRGSQSFKTVFNRETMYVNTKGGRFGCLSRDVTAPDRAAFPSKKR